jgi:phenylalanyl-tRNA synthetase beta chain
MKASIEWVKSFQPALKATPDAIRERLTQAGIEVEGAEDQAAAFRGVVVGEVLKLERHPQADKLQIAKVNDGDAELTIICGAPNVAVGQKVAVARIGTKLPNGIEIAEREIRGTKSFGMICSKKELGLGDDHSGIMVLPGRAKPGKPIAPFIGRTDVVLEISPPANRPDVLSHLGVARELSAIFRLNAPSFSVKPKEDGPASSSLAKVEIKAGQRCPRYVARVIEGVKIGPSPEEVVRRLESVGLRSISNVVDATNLVLLELGHPLHAFDLDKLKEHKIVVRMANAKEKITTLDGVSRELDADDLVIADGEVAVAIAGVMGGGDSEVGEGTTRVLLESAMFDPKSVRRTAKRHGLHTEASHRFERGADPEALELAIDRCAELIVELAGGTIRPGRIAVGKRSFERAVVPIRPERATLVLGRQVDKNEIRATLTALGLKKVSKRPEKKPKKGAANAQNALSFEVPSWRVDLSTEIDLIEEVARLSGFDSIPTEMPALPSKVWTVAPKKDESERVRDVLVGLGFRENVSLAFNSPSQVADLGFGGMRAVEVANPLGEESALMRVSLLPALLRAARHNQSLLRTDLRLFEIGNTFEWTEPPEALPRETLRLALILRGRRSPRGWWGKEEGADVFDLKAAIERLLESMDVSARFSSEDVSWLHPRAPGKIESGGELLGRFGELHPDVAKRFDLEGPSIFVAELSVEALVRARGPHALFRPLPRFPAVSRDLSFFIRRDVPSTQIVEVVRGSAGAALEGLEIFDVYEGKGVPEGKRSVAVALSFRAQERTLTDAEVDAAQEGIIQALEGRLSAEVRRA